VRRGPLLLVALGCVAAPAWAQGIRLEASGLAQRVQYRMRYQNVIEEQTGIWVGGEARALLGPAVLRIGTVFGTLSGGAAARPVERSVRTTTAEIGVHTGEWLTVAASALVRRFETDAGVTTWGLLGGTVRLDPELGFRGVRAVLSGVVYPVRKSGSGTAIAAANSAEAGVALARGRFRAQLTYRVERMDFEAPSSGGTARLEQFRGVVLGLGFALER
jgi:hypothetical protein